MKIVSILLVGPLIFLPQLLWAGDYYTTIKTANVRTGEGIEYPVSFTLSEGEEVEVLSKSSSYYEIRYLEKTGYVYAGYLQYSRSENSLRGWLKSLIIYGGIFLSLVLFGGHIGKRIRKKRLLGTVTTSARGTETERDLVLKLLASGIPAHRIFHDLYLVNAKNDFCQIDLIVLTDVGIIVIEVKKLSGLIFGSGNHSHWTQVLADGKEKYRFYNPIMQNNTHVAALRKKLLPFGNIPFYSMVVFYGNCVLREINYVPRGTFLVKESRALEVVNIILKENERVHYNEAEVFRVLKDAFVNGASEAIQHQHRERIKDMIGKHRIFE